MPFYTHVCAQPVIAAEAGMPPMVFSLAENVPIVGSHATPNMKQVLDHSHHQAQADQRQPITAYKLLLCYTPK